MNEQNKKCIIIVPLYKTYLSNDEIISLNQLFNIIKDYDIIGVVPSQLNLTYYQNNFNFKCFIKVNDIYFLNFPTGYNLLFTNKDFYSIFSDYEYMLIYQLDCLIFRDELEYWCNKGYDYIGGPFLYTVFFNILYLCNYNPKNRVGNGGFSLRKISWCLNVLEHNSFDTFDKSKLNEGEFLNEDTFFANQEGNFPSMYEASKFAWSDHPSILYQMNDGQLPFGAHRVFKYSDIYNIIFKKLNYNLNI